MSIALEGTIQTITHKLSGCVSNSKGMFIKMFPGVGERWGPGHQLRGGCGTEQVMQTLNIVDVIHKLALIPNYMGFKVGPGIEYETPRLQWFGPSDMDPQNFMNADPDQVQ